MGIFSKAFLTCLMSSTSVFASGMTEYFYQPVAGVYALSLSARQTLPDPQIELFSNGSKIGEGKFQIQKSDLVLQYGWSETWALGFGAGYMNTLSETKVTGSGSPQSLKSSGMTDYLIRLDGLTTSGGSGLAYGLATRISSEEAQVATSSKDGNQFSGGNSTSIHAGGYAGLMMGTFGFNLEYAWLQDRRETDQKNPETKSTLKGGNQFALTGFYELDSVNWKYDLRLQYVGIDQIDRTTGSTTVTTANASSYSMIGLGAQTFLGSSMNLRGEYNYFQMKEFVSPTNSSLRAAAYNFGQILVRLRWVF